VVTICEWQCGHAHATGLSRNTFAHHDHGGHGHGRHWWRHALLRLWRADGVVAVGGLTLLHYGLTEVVDSSLRRDELLNLKKKQNKKLSQLLLFLFFFNRRPGGNQFSRSKISKSKDKK
jgi:hypothetical protein